LAGDPPLYPYPGDPNITLDDILPAVEAYLERPVAGPGMKAGEKVLIVSDRSSDPLVAEAYYVAACRLGASQVDTINLQGRLDVKDPTEIILEVFEKNAAWPEWLWDVAAKYDRVVPLAFNNFVNAVAAYTHPERGWVTKWTEATDTVVHTLFTTHQGRERLAAVKDYPGELIFALMEKGYETMRNGRNFHLTDPNGTDVSWTLDQQTWDRYDELWGDTKNNHAPRLHLSDKPDMKGTFVSTLLHSGVIPRIELTIDGGRVVDVKGGGRMGDYLRKAFEEYEDIEYPYQPGPGVNWVEYAVWGFFPTPGFAPLPENPEMAWSGMLHTYNIDLMAGVVHIAVGTSAGGFSADFANDNGYAMHHKDFVLVRPTLTVDGEVIIDNGHLTALDDPEIRAIAAKYGDPDKLLTRTWHPDQDPRFK
jgi:leucyl aminopeptidase (aminopeptidase T)